MIKIATHLPVLEFIKRVSNIKRILELGSGEYSTKKFLEFPNLEILDSYEDDEIWFNAMKKIRDKRLSLYLKKDMVKVVEDLGLDFYDLIFIDCCKFPEKRAAVIKEIAEQHPKKAIVIIHDFENKLYQAEAKFEHKIVYDEILPHTAILWNENGKS